ncbi:P-loop containing nucleoside triphosphate hydrolase protein [Hyaloscypha variabilis]
MATVPDPLARLAAVHGPLLDAVDSLRPLGVNRVIHIPQLIVVGEQNSGKSSVLESISGVQFAVSHNLCTRFPIELALRKSKDEKTTITASIIPGKHVKKSRERLSSLLKFSHSGCDSREIPRLIDEAKAAMGIQTENEDRSTLNGSNDGAKQFTDDILRIEIHGPQQHPITLIDLPGCYHSSSSEQGDQGIAFVKKMVERYMDDEKSIILVVVSASTEPAVQSVTNLAKKKDVLQERTLGIITRPDATQPGPERERIVRLAKNELIPLKRGWHTVRNLSTEERQSKQTVEGANMSKRDQVEASFLSTGEWADLSPANKGIESLRSKLSVMLVEQIRSSLPELIREVDNLKKARSKELEELGIPRITSEDHLKFMMPMAQEFSRIAHAAIAGIYEDDFFGKPGDRSQRTQDTKLRANVTEMSLLFGNVMMACGRKARIDQDEDGIHSPTDYSDSERENDSNDNGSRPARARDEDLQSDEEEHRTSRQRKGKNKAASDIQDNSVKSDDDDQKKEQSPKAANEEGDPADIFSFEYHPNSAVLAKDLFRGIESPVLAENVVRTYYTHPMPISVKWNALETFITSEVGRWKGQEAPGDTNSSLTKALFKEQSKPWTWIVESHFSAVWAAIDTFVGLALQHSVHKSVRTSVMREIVRGALRELRLEFKGKCTEIVDGFRDMHPAQYTGYLSSGEMSKSAKQTVERLKKAMETVNDKNRVADPTCSFLTALPFESRLLSAARSWELADICLYICAMNVSGAVQVLAVENCIRKVPEVFSPAKLSKVKRTKLCEAGKEGDEATKLRERLTEELSILSKTSKTFQKYRKLSSLQNEETISDNSDTD